jgi:hypothetical protein
MQETFFPGLRFFREEDGDDPPPLFVGVLGGSSVEDSPFVAFVVLRGLAGGMKYGDFAGGLLAFDLGSDLGANLPLASRTSNGVFSCGFETGEVRFWAVGGGRIGVSVLGANLPLESLGRAEDLAEDSEDCRSAGVTGFWIEDLSFGANLPCASLGNIKGLAEDSESLLRLAGVTADGSFGANLPFASLSNTECLTEDSDALLRLAGATEPSFDESFDANLPLESLFRVDTLDDVSEDCLRLAGITAAYSEPESWLDVSFGANLPLESLFKVDTLDDVSEDCLRLAEVIEAYSEPESWLEGSLGANLPFASLFRAEGFAADSDALLRRAGVTGARLDGSLGANLPLESLFNVAAFADDPDDCLRLAAGVTGSYSEPESSSGTSGWSGWSRLRGSGDELVGANLPFAPRTSERGFFTESVGGEGGVFEDCESGAISSTSFGKTLGILPAIIGMMRIDIASCLL